MIGDGAGKQAKHRKTGRAWDLFVSSPLVDQPPTNAQTNNDDDDDDDDRPATDDIENRRMGR